MLVPYQLAGILGAMGFQIVAYGTIGPLFPVFVLFLSSCLAYLWLSRSREQWPSKEVRIKQAVRSSCWFAGFTIVLYGGYFGAQSDVERVVIAPFIALGLGLAVLMLTLVAGDTAAQILGVAEEETSVSEVRKS